MTRGTPDVHVQRQRKGQGLREVDVQQLGQLYRSRTSAAHGRQRGNRMIGHLVSYGVFFALLGLGMFLLLSNVNLRPSREISGIPGYPCPWG